MFFIQEVFKSDLEKSSPPKVPILNQTPREWGGGRGGGANLHENNVAT